MNTNEQSQYVDYQNEIKNTVEELWGKIGKSLNKSFRPKEGRLWAGSSGYCMRKFIAKKNPAWLGLPIIEKTDTFDEKLGAHVVGRFIHEKLDEIISEHSYELSMVGGNERYLKYEGIDPDTNLSYEITGRYDLMLLVPDGNLKKPVLVDWKTFRANRKYKSSQVMDSILIKEPHFMQLSFYAAMQGGVDSLIIYVTRDDMELHIVGLGWEDPNFGVVCPSCDRIHNLPEHMTGKKLWAKVQEKAIRMVRAENNKTLPPREEKYDKNSWECKNACDYYKQCYGEWDLI